MVQRYGQFVGGTATGRMDTRREGNERTRADDSAEVESRSNVKVVPRSPQDERLTTICSINAGTLGHRHRKPIRLRAADPALSRPRRWHRLPE